MNESSGSRVWMAIKYLRDLRIGEEYKRELGDESHLVSIEDSEVSDKRLRARGGCLGTCWRRRTEKATKECGELPNER